LRRFAKQIFSHLLVAGLVLPAAFASNKEETHDLLAKSFQQADLWTQGPVKLEAKVRMPIPNGSDLNLVYTVSWAGPDKWRAEWSAPGLQQIAILNNGKLTYMSNQKAPLVRAIQFEAALAMLDGANPAGPCISMPPLEWDKAKFDVSKKKINGVDAKCIAFGQPTETLCIDAASGHMLSADGDIGTFEYSDYTTMGSNSYPQTINASYVKTSMAAAKVTVTRGDKFADSVFMPPDGSTTIDYASCADVDKNFTPPHLTKIIQPKMPEAAKKANKYGMVWVLADVGKDGEVQKTTVMGGEPELSSAATDAVQKYKFTPYMRCGQAVGFEKIVVVPFLPPSQGPGDISVSPK
jgi:hypothetical protein